MSSTDFLEKFPTVVRPYDGSKPRYEDDIPEKQNLFFGCNYQDQPTIIINWSEKGRGFGSYTFFIKDGKLMCDNECDSRETVKRILCAMVDQAEFVDENDFKNDER